MWCCPWKKINQDQVSKTKGYWSSYENDSARYEKHIIIEIIKRFKNPMVLLIERVLSYKIERFYIILK